MQTTRKFHKDGSITQTNYMLDDIIDAFDEHKLSHDDELIKKLTIQKIEYARRCMFQLLGEGGMTEQAINACKRIDAKLQEKIIEVGGKPVQYGGVSEPSVN